MKKILITGASGLVGSHVAEKFIKEGIPVTCLVRKTSDLKWIKQNNLEVVYGDLADKASLINALNGFDFVIHTAAKARDWGKYRDFYEINVKGTINLLEACLANKIKNVIFTGSISTYGEENNYSVKSEESPHNSHYPYFAHKIFPSAMNFYRDTKAEATRQAINFSKEHKLNLTVLEPGWIYGEREFHSGFYEYLQEVKNGMRFAPGSTRNRFQIIYAGDLANAYYLVYKKKFKGINRYIIGGEPAEKMDNIYQVFCDEAGYAKPKLVPKWILYPIGFCSELIYSILGSKKAPTLTRSRVNMFYDNIEFSSQKAEKEVGLHPEYSLKEGISRTVKWYKDQNLL